VETDALYWDPYDARFVDDPWPVFNRIREEAPLYYNQTHDFYALSRYADVERAVSDYEWRWPVAEEYHKVEKSGLKIESQRFESYGPLAAALAIIAVVAIGVLQLRYARDSHPEASAKTIARNLDRSHYTIINHTRRIFAAFGVRSRARLIARCVELGIASEVRTAIPLARAATRNRSGDIQKKR